MRRLKISYDTTASLSSMKFQSILILCITK